MIKLNVLPLINNDIEDGRLKMLGHSIVDSCTKGDDIKKIYR